MIVAAVMATALASLRASEAAERCEPAVARIVSIQGLVEVQPAGAADWVVAALDDRLCFGDTIRVGEFARAALALANNSVLRFDQRTTLRLAGEVESGRSLLDLLFGDVHFFSHRPRALEVDTPIANAAAEGTEFLVRARPERTEVVMLDGRVRLTTAEGEVLLASGDGGGCGRGRGAAARGRGAAAGCGRLGALLPAGAGAAGRGRGAAGAAAGSAARARAGRGQRLCRARWPRSTRCRKRRAMPAITPTARACCCNVGRVEEAAAAIERALALDPEAAAALAQRAIIAVVQNRREAALADARRAVELAPDSAPARIALSYALQAAFELEEARAVLRAAAARSPDDPLVFARLAELELAFGDLGAAQAAAERAVALAPGLARTQMVLGFAALTRIAIDEAKAAFARAIELDSAEPLARLGLGLATIREGELEAGRRELEIAAALDPNNSLLRSYLGKAYFEERRGPLDAEQFRIAKELDPNDPTPYFYDAIRLQTENRPVEALRELERSIALNDNRAVYRSRLLLDQDSATRGVSLARIYDDLGFEQLGVNEAARSLLQDPANSAAHRFLADLYARRPRHEVAQVSELLQSQLLQPVGRNPIQPSLPFTDLDLVARSGPADLAFNEFTPLFTRQGVRADAAGVVGTDSTFGDEVAATALVGRAAFSVGQFHYETDGFRENNDLQHNIYTLFGQADVTQSVSLQAEYRYRKTDSGDRELNFDLDEFRSDFSDNIEEDVFRVGGRFTPAPGQIGLVSAIYTDRDDSEDLLDPDFGLVEDEVSTDVGQLEAQYLGVFGSLRLVGGAGWAESSERFRESEEGFAFPDVRSEVTAGDVYLTGSLALSPTLDLTARLGYANVESEDKEDQEETAR